MSGWRPAFPPVGPTGESSAIEAIHHENDFGIQPACLPEAFRTAVYYADIQGYAYAEIATKLNIPIGTVMSRISRGRQRLRIALAHLDRRRGNIAAVQQRTA